MAVRKFTDVNFEATGQAIQLLSTGAVVAGGDTDVNWILMGSPPEQFECSTLAASTEKLWKKHATLTGIVPPVDATNNEGFELTQGILAGAKSRFTVGTDPAFYFSCRLGLTTVADYDVLVAGFRGKLTTGPEAYAAVASVDTPAEIITAYDTVGGVNVQSGTLHGVTRLAAGTGVDTTLTTTWADAAVKTLTVKVSAAGVVTAAVDGTALADFVSVTFAAGTVVSPYLLGVKGQNGATSTLQLKRWTCGYQ